MNIGLSTWFSSTLLLSYTHAFIPQKNWRLRTKFACFLLLSKHFKQPRHKYSWMIGKLAREQSWWRRWFCEIFIDQPLTLVVNFYSEKKCIRYQICHLHQWMIILWTKRSLCPMKVPNRSSWALTYRPPSFVHEAELRRVLYGEWTSLTSCPWDAHWVIFRFTYMHYNYMGFLGGTGGKESACQWRRHKVLMCGLIPGSGRFPWREAWQPTPVFLSGESHGQKNLAGQSPWGCTESDTTEVTWHVRTLWL